MQQKINKIMWILIPLLVVFLIIIIVFDKKNKEVEYQYHMFYMDTYIYLKIYSNNNETANKIADDVKKIFEHYNDLANKYEEIDGINNLYYINYNNSKEEYISIDEDLYKLIEYGITAYNKTNGLVDISMGNVLDIWKSYRDSGYSVPTLEELQKANTNSINDIILDNNKIKNNHPNIDLGAVAKGYTVEQVKEYFKQNKIEKYILNAGGNVIVGDKIANEKYSIGIEDPDNDQTVIKVIYGNNIAVVTSGGYQRFYEWQGKKYSHIIDPNTLYPTNYMKSVTVILSDSALGDVLSTMLFLMPVEDGVNYINSLDGVEAIWYTNDNQIITSNGIKKYEQK